MKAPVYRSRIVHVLIVVAFVALALVVGSVSLHTLERWVAPAAAILISHVGALVLLGVLLKWQSRRRSPRSGGPGS
jgi:hypothetical protein